MSKRAEKLVTLATAKLPNKKSKFPTPVLSKSPQVHQKSPLVHKSPGLKNKNNSSRLPTKILSAQVGSSQNARNIVGHSGAKSPIDTACGPPTATISSNEKVHQWRIENLKDMNDQTNQYVRNAKRKLDFNKSGKPAGNVPVSQHTSKGPDKSSSIVRVSKNLISPSKHGKQMGKKKQDSARCGSGNNWRNLVPDNASLHPENLSIVMEYADDDMRPPNFFIEENVGAAHNLLDIDQVIDLSPSKRPRLDHTNKVARGPTVRVSHTHILPDTDKGFPKKKKADETLNSQSTDWRNLKPSSAPHQANSDSSMDMFEDGAHQDNVTVVPNENEGSLEKSPSKSLQSQPIISSPEQEQQNLNGSDDEHESVQENNREPLPTASKQTRIMIPKESKRKRSVNTKVWKRNMASQAFNDGLEHVTSKGNLKAARVMGDPCRDNCKRCKGELTHSEREHIFHTFWNLPNINRKRDYISRHIKIRTPDTCHTSPECAKKTSRHYFFAVRGEEILVCKTMFLNTLGVADNWIETSLRKSGGGTLSPDKRGRHRNRPNEASLETVQSVRDHINLFPRIPSHYTRERSKREYLETEVNSIQRMYKLYLEWAKENNITKPASASKYRKIFNTEFNLGFFLPKKDQCEMCNKWKHAENQGERENIVQAYATHLKNKKEVKILKENDVKSASDKKCVACFDLQKVLICPRAETSILFYKNKLSLFNFTVFDTREKEGNCYLWTECDAHKGPNEIGTNLLRFIEKKISEGVEEFSFYSDSPTGQNRNRMIFSLYLCASAKYHVNITHRFLESGHSYTEADSIHARIEEEAKRVQEIFTPDEWITLIKNAKQNGKSYLVSTLKNEEVLDLHYLVDRQNWSGQSKSKIYWSQVREVSVHRDHPNILSYRYNFSDECSTLKVTMKQGQMPDMETFQFPLAYSGRFPLQKNKVNDLKELMKKNTIPSRLHAVFESYLNIAVPDQDDVDD